SASLCATSRVTVSELPPGGNGTTMGIGRDGKSDWANATGAAAIKPAATQAKVQATTIAFFIGLPPFGVSGRHGLRANVDHGGAEHVGGRRVCRKAGAPARALSPISG